MFTFVIGLTTLGLILDLLFFASFIFVLEKEYFPLAFAEILILFPAIAYFMFDVNVYLFIASNIVLSLILFASYIAIGALWSVFKWWRYSRSEYIQNEIVSNWESFKLVTKNKEPTREDFLKNSVYNPLWRNGYNLSDKNNWKIANWMMLWPVSIFWSFLRNITIDLYTNLISLMSNIFDKITNNAINLK